MTKRKKPSERQRERKGLGSTWNTKDGRVGAAIPVPVRDESGRVIKRRKRTTRNTQEEADAWLEEMRGIATSGGLRDRGSEQTLREHLEVWLRDSLSPRLAPNTMQKRVWAVSNHIAPALGHLKLSDVGPQDVQRLYASLAREGYKPATRREVHVTLKQAMSQAVRWGLVERNPASPELVDAPKQPRRTDEEDEIRSLAGAQARRLFARAAEVESRWRNYYVVAVRTGLRPGEALGLRWADLDLDLDPASLRVRRTLDTHGAARFGPPKTPASRRTLALHHEAKDALISQREMLASEGLPTREKALVFPSEAGTPMSSNNLRKRHLHRHLRDAGLPRLSLHELRHTFASIALFEWGLPPKIVMSLMGHENLKMTMDLYGHLMPGAEADAMRRLNEMHRGEKTPKTGLTEARKPSNEPSGIEEFG